jgi:hypothetical protein
MSASTRRHIFSFPLGGFALNFVASFSLCLSVVPVLSIVDQKKIKKKMQPRKKKKRCQEKIHKFMHFSWQTNPQRSLCGTCSPLGHNLPMETVKVFDTTSSTTTTKKQEKKKKNNKRDFFGSICRRSCIFLWVKKAETKMKSKEVN